MNINSQERQALFTSKLIEGKDENTANSEILRDLKFIKDFNQLKRDKTNELKDLERLKDKLLKEVNKLRQSLLKLESSPIPKPVEKELMNFGDVNGNHQKIATTIMLKRVINYLQEHPSLVDTNKLADFCCINHSQAKDAQNFINRYVRLENG